MKREHIKFKDRKTYDKVAIGIGAVLELVTFLEGRKMTSELMSYLWGPSKSIGRTLINLTGGAVVLELVDKFFCDPAYRVVLRIGENDDIDDFLDDPEDDDLVTDDIVVKIRKEEEDGESE